MFNNNATQQNTQHIRRGIKRSSELDAVPLPKSIKIIPQSPTQGDTSPSESFNKRKELERDENVLSRRQKQIDFGKNTLAYDKYRMTVPVDKRTKNDPKTPPKHLQMNRRAFDGLVKNWKIKLHKWDAKNSADIENTSR